MKRLKLSSPAEIRRTLNRIANMLVNRQIDPKTANAVIYACTTALNAIDKYELEKRLETAEELLEKLQRHAS